MMSFGAKTICMASGVWIAEWMTGHHTDHAFFLAFMGAGYVVYGLIILGAQLIYRRLA